MGIARARQQALKARMRVKGQVMIVHKKFNTPEVSHDEVKGLMDTAGQSSSQAVFEFPDKLEIGVGDVLQVKDSRDYWRVTGTRDIVEGNIFINVEVRAEQIK